jgi:hypothetical protein
MEGVREANIVKWKIFSHIYMDYRGYICSSVCQCVCVNKIIFDRMKGSCWNFHDHSNSVQVIFEQWSQISQPPGYGPGPKWHVSIKSISSLSICTTQKPCTTGLRTVAKKVAKFWFLGQSLKYWGLNGTSEHNLSCPPPRPPRGRLLALLKNINLSWKGLIGTNTPSYLARSKITSLKNIDSTGCGNSAPYVYIAINNTGPCWPRAQCYKTFYVSNLRIFIIS